MIETLKGIGNSFTYLLTNSIYFDIFLVYMVACALSYNLVYEKTIDKMHDETENDGTVETRDDGEWLYVSFLTLVYPIGVILQTLSEIVLSYVAYIMFRITATLLALPKILFYTVVSLITTILLTLLDKKPLERNETLMNTNTPKVMTKDNVLLYEKHDIHTNEAINTDDGKTYMVHGVKIFRVIKPENGEFNVIAQYLAETDSIDLSCLHDYTGWYMVS